MVTEAKATGALTGIPAVISIRVSTCEVEYGLDNGMTKTVKMEFNLVDRRNNQILAKARLYEGKCECGCYKCHGFGKAHAGHADYCGWKQKDY